VGFYKLAFLLKRARHRKKARATALAPLYQQKPFSPSQKFMNTRFLAVDCEMSGLDAQSNRLLSIGWVAITNGRIAHGSARHLLIHAEEGAGESTKIHGLHDTHIAGGKSAAAVLMLLMKQMDSAVLLFHHAPVDVRFLQAACKSHFRCPLLFSYADTLALEKRRMQLRGKTGGLRLAECRQRYGLPAVKQHNALADAIATAELFLAQVAESGRKESCKLGDLGLGVS